MQRFFVLFFLAFISAAVPALAISEPGALCHPEEQVLFSCRLEESNRLISLCSSSPFSTRQGYMQYRAGDFNRLEEEFPQRREEYRTLFNYMHVFPVGSDRVTLRFAKDRTMMELYALHDNTPQGVRVEQGLHLSWTDRPEVFLRCRPPVIDNLLQLEQIFQ